MEGIGGFLCMSFVLAVVMLTALYRVVRTIDDEGEIKNTAKDGFAEVFRKIFKK